MANRIALLPPAVADKIAAGEVIERPASVVKELVENALDAGSTEIQVTLEDGGKQLIEVLDNGHGMGPEDLKLCAERHATSKLRNLTDLEKISTLGFRGEALPSIGAVSDLSIISRAEDETQTYEFKPSADAKEAKPEKVTFGHFLHSQHGTRVRVGGLFSTIPARLKFMKSAGAEVAAVREWLERLALAHPHVGFRLVSNDRPILELRPQTQENRVKQILSDVGEEFPLVQSESVQDGLRNMGLHVRVYWLQGMSVGHTRKIVQVVNGRSVRDRMLQQALASPFRQALLPGRFPAAAVFLEVSPAAIDVNVHPSKTEVRFLDSRKVFQIVEETVSRMIAEQGAPSFATTPQMPWQTFGQAAFETPRQTSWQAREPESQTLDFPKRDLPPFQLESPPTPHTQFPLGWTEEGGAPQAFAPSVSARNAPLTSFGHPFSGARFIGECFKTYLMYELEGELILIDQHAADERIRFENLRRKVLSSAGEPLGSQTLLIPEAIQFPEESRALIAAQLEGLSRFGFEVELFSENTLLFRSIPCEWGMSSLKQRLKSLVLKLIEQEEKSESGADSTSIKTALWDEKLFETLASEACHSSVRAREPLEKEEMQSLFTRLFQCEHPWNCPHGRPTVVKVTQGKIEEWFHRKV